MRWIAKKTKKPTKLKMKANKRPKKLKSLRKKTELKKMKIQMAKINLL